MYSVQILVTHDKGKILTPVWHQCPVKQLLCVEMVHGISSVPKCKAGEKRLGERVQVGADKSKLH